jgi:hypothetical protein
MPDVKCLICPEITAGGFSRADGTIEFYQRVCALLRRAAAVLDLGAGRGQVLEDTVTCRPPGAWGRLELSFARRMGPPFRQ